MLTSDDLQAIDGLIVKRVSEVVKQELKIGFEEFSKKEIVPIKKDIKKIQKDLKVIINHFDRENLSLRGTWTS